MSQADRKSIIANINFESTPVWEKVSSLMGIGARFSTFEDVIKSVAKEQGLAYFRNIDTARQEPKWKGALPFPVRQQ